MMRDDWFETNRRMWDERVPIHVTSDFYDVEGFKSGSNTLRDFEVEDVGDVVGKSLLHLQCHFGLDTMSWARLGAEATGLDFSRPAVEAARRIADDCDIEATFVVGDVYEAPQSLGRRFDVVYTGIGALCWLPDIERWAETVSRLTAPGGLFYLTEFHPVTETMSDDDFTVQYPYFTHGPMLWDEAGTYTDSDVATEHNKSFEWTHPVSSVVDALLRQGFQLTRFREMDYTLFARWPFLIRTGRDRFDIPPGKPKIPLMYAVRFVAP